MPEPQSPVLAPTGNKHWLVQLELTKDAKKLGKSALWLLVAAVVMSGFAQTDMQVGKVWKAHGFLQLSFTPLFLGEAILLKQLGYRWGVGPATIVFMVLFVTDQRWSAFAVQLLATVGYAILLSRLPIREERRD